LSENNGQRYRVIWFDIPVVISYSEHSVEAVSGVLAFSSLGEIYDARYEGEMRVLRST
jgi:hypothetical protein